MKHGARVQHHARAVRQVAGVRRALGRPHGPARRSQSSSVRIQHCVAITTEATTDVDAVQDDAEAGKVEAAVEAKPTEAKKKPRRGMSKKNVEKVKETLSGMKSGDSITGTVKRIQEFGAFVDIGVGKDALLHISQVSNEYTRDVSEKLSEGQEVEGHILSIDVESLKIQITLRTEEAGNAKPKPKKKRTSNDQKLVGTTVKGKVTSIKPFGCFVDIGNNKTGLMHVSEIVDEDGLDSITDTNIKEGLEVEVLIAEVNPKRKEFKLKPTAETLSKIKVDSELEDVDDSGIPPAMPFFMKEFGIVRAMFPDRPDLAYVPGVHFYPSESLPSNPDGRAYKIVGNSYTQATNWANVIPTGDAIAAPEEPATAVEVDAPAEEAVSEPEPEPEAAAVEASATVETEAPAEAEPAVEDAPKPAISAKLVKELRDQSGAGMMDCKKALAECDGDVAKAEEYLRQKGITSAAKKASRIAAEGMVSSYIHAGSRIGVLVEVNCETDFVARGEKFKELVQGLAMQIAASPSVEYISTDDASPEFVEAEKKAEMQKEDLASKPENIREQIVEGRVNKILKERALLEQAYIMDTNKTVGDAITEAIASIGENIKVRRFSRFVLGEGIEKKEADFAKEVEEQMSK